MSKLSIFVDESGDFGLFDKHSPYYIVAMVFHNQNNSIDNQINKLNQELNNINYYNLAIHTEPLIRKEGEYGFLPPNERRKIFTKLYYFAIKSEINYKTFIYAKNEYTNIFELQAKMAKDMTVFIKDHYEYFQSFDEIVLYYDNGQYQLTNLLNTMLALTLFNYEIRKVLPSDYKLFQVADMICTLELINLKTKKQELSRSEELIFHSKSQFKKDFIKAIRKKEFK